MARVRRRHQSFVPAWVPLSEDTEPLALELSYIVLGFIELLFDSEDPTGLLCDDDSTVLLWD